jgi:D-alanine transaminase
MKQNNCGARTIMEILIINDQILPLCDAPSACLDRGTFFGDGVYEVLRSYNGKIFALKEHLERFSQSLAAVEITGIDVEQIRQRVLQAYAAAGISNARIYFHATRGSAPREHSWDSNLKPNFLLMVTQLSDETEHKTKGIAVSAHPDWRWKRCDIKSLNLLANVLARRQAAKKSCAEAILVDDQGLITEGASSAFFAIIDGRLQTAPLTANILPSITRKYVIKAAAELGLEIVRNSLSYKQALEADELFIAATTQDIVPVVHFDDKTIGTGRPGKATLLLMEKFRSYVL